MTFDGSEFKRIHDRALDADAPYGAYVLRHFKNNVEWLNTHVGAACSLNYRTTRVDDPERSQQIRPFRWRDAPGDPPESVSILQVPWMARPGIKKIKATLWARVADNIDDSTLGLASGESHKEPKVGLSVPGALQTTTPPAHLSAISRKTDAGSNIHFATYDLEVELHPSFSTSINGLAYFLVSLDLGSTGITKPDDGTTSTNAVDNHPALLRNAGTQLQSEGDSTSAPTRVNDEWSICIQGEFSSGPAIPISFEPETTVDWIPMWSRSIKGEVSANIDSFAVPYIQIRGLTFREEYYALDKQYSGAAIDDGDVRAETPARSTPAQAIVDDIGEIDSRPDLLVAGTTGHDPGTGTNWGPSSSAEMWQRHPFSSDADGTAETVINERARTHERYNRGKFHIMALPSYPTGEIFDRGSDGLTDSQTMRAAGDGDGEGWEDFADDVLQADIDFTGKISEVAPSGVSVLDRSTVSLTDVDFYRSNATSLIPILQQQSALTRETSSTEYKHDNRCVTEGYMDIVPNLRQGDLKDSDPQAIYLWPDLWVDFSDAQGGRPLRVELRVTIKNASGSETQANFVDRQAEHKVSICGFSFWAFT